MATTYKPRTTCPTKGDKFYTNYSKGGYNVAIAIDEKTGWVMPNCVGYCQGRARELINDTNVWSKIGCNLSGNAETFYGNAQKCGMKTSPSTPKLGAIVCWEGKGDACGHVAVVEEIKSNGDIVCSESGYNSFEFRMQTYYKSKGYLYVTDGSRPLLGFIYSDVEFTAPKTTTTKTTSTKTTTKTTKKSIEEVAKDVISGKYGNGSARKKKLESEGYNYDEVQAKVSELLNPPKTTTTKTTSTKTSTKSTTSTTQTAYFVYTIVKGDTLWKIANKYNVKGSYQELMRYNNLATDVIYPGQKIKIPK